MRRRDFLAFLGGTVAAWPLEVRAQQRTVTPTIGLLERTAGTSIEQSAAFYRGLAEQGYVAGRDVNVEYRNAEGDDDRLRALTDDLVRRQVAVIVTTSGGATHVAKAATQTIPIVFAMGGDPVEEGLVASLNRPGGNVTGVAILAGEIAAKRLELLHELAPKAESIAALLSSSPASSDYAREEARGFQSAALAHGVRLLTMTASNASDIAGAFARAVEQRAGALVVGADRPFFDINAQLISLADRYSLPTMFFRRGAVAAGALASYGSDPVEASLQQGVYTGRILKGDKPADLPVQRTVKFELAINLKTARALGLTVPLPLLASADEVIE
jgi:putative ABC transport system substrate-binding protein